jgi:spore germination protein YaaH
MSATPPNMPPVRQPKQGSGAGCWLTAFISLFVAMILVMVGLFLPPLSLFDRLFSEQYDMLNAENMTVALGNEFSIGIGGDELGESFGVQLSKVSLNDFETANTIVGDWILAAKSSLPFYLALQSPVYTIESTGDAPSTLQLSLNLPINVATSQVLDVYGWDGNEWRFIPSRKANGKANGLAGFLPQQVAIFQTISAPPIVQVSYDIAQDFTQDVANLATIISPGGLQPSRQGTLIGSLAPGADANSGYRLMPMISNYDDPRATDPETVELIISNPALRNEHVSQITSVASQNGYDGIFIDYRDISDEFRSDFTLFINELGDNFSDIGLLLGVVVPQATNTTGDWETGAYNWRAIGATTDYLKVRMGSSPLNYAPDETQVVNAMMRWAVDDVSRYKILLGLSAQSIRDIEGVLTRIGYDEAIAGMGNVVVVAESVSETGSIEPGSEIRASLDGLDAIAGVDLILNAPFLDYMDENGNTLARIWLTTSSALNYRMEHTIPFALAGVAFDDLLRDDLVEGLPQTILNYKAQVPAASSPTDLALRWSIEGSDGLFDEVVTGLNDDLVVTLTAPDGNYAINIAVIGIGEEAESQRTGAAVALFAPTATPTPLPTATPTPIPTETPTPVPITLTSPPPPPSNNTNTTANDASGFSGPTGGGFQAVAPPPGSINIELGGHVLGTNSGRAIGPMHTAGMTWMKIQARFNQGGPPNMAGDIANAHNNGFKILIGTVGNPAELAQGGQGYINSYAGWLAQIAGQGADAIEVWNEPNLDREWPQGQISGAAYAGMLQAGYQAIKSANPNTMVISAAPAPTGAEAAFPGQVMNDDKWLRQMVDAGGLNYLDCVGAHYNEGIVPPSQTSGDPRDSYYTRYFYGMLNTYSSITGRPICFTELGYLTSEGYPGLPSFFSWAQHVTLGQQAAWLAEAAALASQSGQVRLFIVWNIDFTHYGADPQGGYAIIRPNGSCPACSALANAR